MKLLLELTGEDIRLVESCAHVLGYQFFFVGRYQYQSLKHVKPKRGYVLSRRKHSSINMLQVILIVLHISEVLDRLNANTVIFLFYVVIKTIQTDVSKIYSLSLMSSELRT